MGVGGPSEGQEQGGSCAFRKASLGEESFCFRWHEAVIPHPRGPGSAKMSNGRFLFQNALFFIT